MKISLPRLARPDRVLVFAPEWIALAAIVAIDAVWAECIGVHFDIALNDFVLPASIVAIAVFLRVARQEQGALAAEFLAVTLSMAIVFTVLSYLSLASSSVLADDRLEALDRAIGFDWLVGFRLMTAHPWIEWTLDMLYRSLNFQALYACILLGLMRREARMRELFWLLLVAALLTDLGALLFPSFGPFKMFGLESRGGFLPDMERLVAGRDLDFVLANLTGVINFPSFHTVMALTYAYAFRDTDIIGRVIAAANGGMLLAVPFVGGHYLIDVIGGVAVFAIALGLVKLRGQRMGARLPARWGSFVPAGVPTMASPRREGTPMLAYTSQHRAAGETKHPPQPGA